MVKKINTDSVHPSIVPIGDSGLDLVNYLGELMTRRDDEMIEKEKLKDLLSISKQLNAALKIDNDRYKTEVKDRTLEFNKYKFKQELENGHN